MISLVFTFLLAVTPSTAGSGECADSVQGVPFSSSRCMETYQGAQCTVTCTDGTAGESTFTCLNGIWIGDLVCQPLPQKPKFALFAHGQFCDSEDFEHIYFGSVTSAAECAYKVSQNSLCTNTFYTGCCGSAVCACVRIGMRCAMEEADEEYLGTNVYQLINSNHPGQFDIMKPLLWDEDLDIMNPLFWDQDLSPSFDGIFLESPAEWNMPTGKCTDSVQVPFGISRCMDTSEGDQCIVTCMGGKTGVGAFICANGNWMGDFNVCRPPQDQRDAGRRLLHVGRLLSLEE